LAASDYLRSLVERDGDETIRRHLERRFRPRWRDRSEWRIGTETEESIERRDDGWEVTSSCDLRFVARVPAVESALTARELLYSLHGKLFYGLGWPSWASYMQMDPDDPPQEPFAADAEPYMKELHRRSNEQYAPLTAEIESAGAWSASEPDVVKRITMEEEYPEVPREATEAVVPELWFRCEVQRSAMEVTWRSPTAARALLFVGIIEALTGDIESTFGWR
jgi:hypothetical protein